MEKTDGAGTSKIPIALVAGFALVILIIAFAFFYQGSPLSGPAPSASASPNPANNPARPNPGSDTSTPPGSATGEDALWIRINNGLVESACLSEAKRQAGNNAWAVRGCSCNASETQDEKSYNCSIGALDGSHPMSADCMRQSRSCIITSGQGSARLSFEQLAAMVGV